MNLKDRALTTSQYKEIMQRIMSHHRFARGGRNIKYVRPDWDMRYGTCFHIEFDNCDVKFDYRDNLNSMYENITDWLSQAEGSNEDKAL